jgi:hypothetical protein
MAYPSLPTSTYLNPGQSGNNRSSSHTSGSASSVEPLTPELLPMSNMPQHYSHQMSSNGNSNGHGGHSDHTQYNGNSSNGNSGEDTIECKWKDCNHVASSPDELYDHLCNQHVGRKSTNNLCLTCGWEGCGVKCVKRDHITSHLRGEWRGPEKIRIPRGRTISLTKCVFSPHAVETTPMFRLWQDVQATTRSQEA